MKLALRPIDVAALRTDGGTQVRESLNEEWIAELMSLIEDGGHDLPPISVVEDGGTYWVFDGHHRVEALRRLRWGAATCAVRCQGTLDDAKYFAAAANKHGLPRSAGDKKRAVLLALATPEGKRMGIRELSRHCGVSFSHTQRIVGAVHEVTPKGHLEVGASLPTQGASARQVLWARIDAALRADHARTNPDIAGEVGCHEDTIRHRRRILGIGRSDPARKYSPTKAVAKELLDAHPDWPNARIAKESGASPITVTRLREQAGLPRSAARGNKYGSTSAVADPPTAPTRKSGDPREAAQVIQLRPPPGVSATVTEAMRLVERMTETERDAFSESCASRWPTTFGAQRNGRAGGA